jgi:hypothetical protein
MLTINFQMIRMNKNKIDETAFFHLENLLHPFIKK